MHRTTTAAAISGLLALAAMAGLAVSPALGQTAPLKQAPDGRRLQMTFSDDFNSLRRIQPGRKGGAGTWLTVFGDGSKTDVGNRTLKGNGELQVYVEPEMPDAQGRPMGLNPFAVHDGVLDLTADRAPAQARPQIGGYEFVSGLISSQPSFSQLYGYFEARVKLPRGKGLWPAVWMLPEDLSWPPEIDIMESIGDPLTAYMTVHSKPVPTNGTEVHPGSDGFHTYAVAWDAQQTAFYLDGKETLRMPTPSDMHKPMFILANLALGGGWAGPPDQTTPFPAKFSIDFIRVYRFVQ